MKFTAPAALLFLASLAVATEAPVARSDLAAEVAAPVAPQVEQDLPIKRDEDSTLEKRKGGGRGGGGGGHTGDA